MYEIRFKRCDPASQDDIARFRLIVSKDGEDKGVTIEANGSLIYAIAHRVDGEPSSDVAQAPNTAAACLRAGLSKLEARLRSGWLPLADSGALEAIQLSQDECEEIVAGWREKTCAWRSEGERGPLCAASRGSDRRTIRSVCDRCPAPDTASRCHNLVHVETRESSDQNGFDRMLVSALCDARAEPNLPRLTGCGIGVDLPRECWRRRVETSAPLRTPVDVADRIVDEIDFFRLVYKEAYGPAAIWPFVHARSVACLFASPASLAEFQSHLSSLVDLLDQLSPPERPDGTTAAKSTTRLQALESVLANDHPDLVTNVALLRRVFAVRRGLVHSNTKREDLIGVCRDLGVDYPPRDWPTAWHQLLGSCWRNIRALRMGLQSSPTIPD